MIFYPLLYSEIGLIKEKKIKIIIKSRTGFYKNKILLG